MKYFDVSPKDLEIYFGKYIKIKNAKIPIKRKKVELIRH